MSQNLRVALWVPNVNPNAIGDAIRTVAGPTVNKRIPSEFAAGGGGGADVIYADQGEVTLGTVDNEAISPLTLRTDNARMLDIPAAAFTGIVALQTSSGAASANKLVKTNVNGQVDESMIPLDGGTF